MNRECPITDAMIAINCNIVLPASASPISNHLKSLLENSLATNTIRSYRADLAAFHVAGHKVPADPIVVAEFLAMSSKNLAVATIRRRAASIGKLHRTLGYPDPCNSEIVRSTIRGVSRHFGLAQNQAKALTQLELEVIVNSMGNRLIDLRDRALLQFGFAGAFRRSELVSINCADVEAVDQGLIVSLRSSKSDQYAEGRQVPICFGGTVNNCPVHALNDWMQATDLSSGPIFRAMDKHGNLKTDRLGNEAINLILKKRLRDAGIDPKGYSAHSLRVGYITSAIKAGLPLHAVMKTSGHRSLSTVMRYVRDASLFEHAQVNMSAMVDIEDDSY